MVSRSMLASTLALPRAERERAIRALRRVAQRDGEAVVAGLCLYELSMMADSLERRAAIQARLARELPGRLAFRALAFTNLLIGRLKVAAKYAALAARERGSVEADQSLGDLRRLIERASQMNESALREIYELQVDAAIDMAIIRSRRLPQESMRCVAGIRRKALKCGEVSTVVRATEALIAIAGMVGDARRLRYYRRQLEALRS